MGNLGRVVVGALFVCGCAASSGSGPFGAPCSGNQDCASGLCLSTAEPFCSRECADDCSCPSGSVCVRVSDTLQVCSPGDNPCATPDDDAGEPIDAELPDGGPVLGRQGAPCTSSSDCGEVESRGGTGPSAELMTVPQECFTSLPGGLCSMTGCALNFRRDPCPTGTACVAITGGSVCVDICEDPTECRPGWTCRTDIDTDPLCWVSCTITGCGAGLECGPDGSCRMPVVVPVDYDVTTRVVALGAPLSPVDGMTTGGANLTLTLPFAIRFFSQTFAAGTSAVASSQGLFALGRSSIIAFTPGDHTRYSTFAPLIVAHHFWGTSTTGGSVSYRVSGTAPARSLEIEWVTTNLSGIGGARFRLRFDEGSDVFVVHYGPITDDAIPDAWTQLAMLDDTQFEEVVVSTGTPTPSSHASTEHTYTPR